MPKSKGRKKKKPASRTYVPREEPKKPKSSPAWYPFFMLGLMGLGVIIIVLFYMQLLPFEGSEGYSYWLWAGLGFIAVGFLAATRYR